MAAAVTIPPLDVKKSISNNHLLGVWRLMSGFRLTYLTAGSSVAVATAARTGTYLLMARFVDQILGTGQPPRVLLAIAFGFVGLAAIEGTFSYFSGRLTARTGQGVAKRLRDFMYDHIQRLTFTYHDKTKTGDLIQRSTSDIEAVQRFASDQLISLTQIVLQFAINFVAVLSLDVKLGLVSVIVVPFLVGVSAFFFRRVSKAYEAYQEQGSKLSTTLQENLTGVRVVRAFNRQEYERNKFEDDNVTKYRKGKHLNTMHSLYWPISDLMCGAQLVSGFLLGAILALDGTLTLGTYLAYTGMLTRIIWPMRNLGRLIVQMSTGLVSYGRVAEIAKEDREPLDEGTYQPDSDVRGEIVFDHVEFAYDGSQPVLHDISLTCRPGDVIALLGSTGSGKTSLVNLLPRFYDYTGGMLTLDGVDLREYPRRYLRRQIGIVEQEPFLFSRTIRENITYGVGRDVSDEEVVAAARAAAIHEVIEKFPEGYSTIVGEKGVTLSGGQKQRVAIARTLLKDPRILILDDSTSSVDTETEIEIRGALERLMKNRTSFVIAHRIQSVMSADQILVLEKGRVVERGTHADLMAQDGTYRRIYDMQARIELELEKEINHGGL